MKIPSHWRSFMVAVGLAAAGCSGVDPAGGTSEDRTSSELAERLKKAIGDGPQSLICGDGTCTNDEDCASCAADCGTCGTCAHDTCITGPALDPACDACVADICDLDPFCCVNFWDGMCVSKVASVCGDPSCPAASCGDSVCSGNETCQSCPADCGACPAPTCGNALCDVAGGETCQTCAADCGTCGGPCSHDKCTTGSPLSPSCDPCTADICAADAYCCSTNWDTICVGEVQSICGNPSCPTASCGDGLCNGSENCQSCAADCGACGGTCSHDTCTTGSPLDPSCDPCTADICAADAYCCTTSWDSVCVGEVQSVCGSPSCPPASCGNGLCEPPLGENCQSCQADCGTCGAACSHDKCQTGGPLDASCGTCVDTVCQSDMFCCMFVWDPVCISKVASLCNETCTPSCGDGTCDAMAGEDCQSCPADCGACGGACAHDMCVTGPLLKANCSPCVDQICQADSYCCSTSWDSVCVNEVASICNQTCP